MPKTKITAPFGKWYVSNGGTWLYRRVGTEHVYVNASAAAVSLRVGGPNVYMGSDLVDALVWADKYILDNYEVEKPVADRLAEAEAEIVALKSRVKELEAAKPTPKFAVGQVVRAIGHMGHVPDERAITKIAWRDGTFRYSRDTAFDPVLLFQEDELEAV